MATIIPRLTKNGAILLAKAIAGNQLTFTRGAFGDAAGADTPSAQQIDNFNALLNEKLSLPIAEFKIQNYQAIVTLAIDNSNLRSGFRIAEGGLFARDPETDNELLYAYFFDGADGAYMPAKSSGTLLEFRYDLITAVANAANVTAVIDKSTIGLSREEFEEHINSSEPHPNWDVVLHPEFNTHINSTNPHPNLPTASETVRGLIKVGENLYMSGDSLNAAASDTYEIDARLKQIEINQANLYILLQQHYGLGPQSNLQQVEDFDPVSKTDMYSARVYSTQSLKYLRVFEPGAIRVGGFFTVTNGRLDQEQTFIKSFAISGDYDTPYLARLDGTLARDYKEEQTYIYRSTVTVKDKKAYGAGEIKAKIWKHGQTWKGEGTSDSAQVEFNAYPSLESALGLDGDWSLTADGYFTLE